ncbi:hypothetical protein GGR21_000425 [Dysgonomonas hofstadii]|uniref:Uncharacterized protein n=1 Tax=Dysgonomonas hofstadii TaxID=637886 RepID=A0A840CKH8_9BACT|nr:DUF5074 domain-containing protein [Dysgonomonas hofstadii]MBB4034538.1 hypothetical protein [Dysgonomonas hofstadii]
MKKYFLRTILIGISAISFFSCDSDDDPDWTEPEVKTTGVYILNSGNYKGNDASLTYYDVENNTVTENVFANVNKPLILGELANDMAIYGSKMYIAVTTSNKIYVTDKKARLVTNGTITPLNDEMPMEPRCILTYEGKIYISTQTGYVLRMDTTTYSYDKVKVGAYPEQMAISGNNLFVANSGQYYDNTVSVVNLNTFSETSKIELPTYNPVAIQTDKSGNIYVLCWDIHMGTSSALYKINATTHAITKIGDDGIGSYILMNGDKLLIMSLDYDANTSNIISYDTTGNTFSGSFVTDGTVIETGNSLNIDPVTGNIYVGTAVYGRKHQMLIFSPDGKLITKFNTGGYYPMGAYFLSEIK